MHLINAREGSMRMIAIILMASLVLSCLFPFGSAFAVTEETEAELTETQKQIEDTADAYNDAVDKVVSLEQQIEENESKLSELEEKLPGQQEKSEQATVALYKLQHEGMSLVGMLLSSGSISEFITSFEYINHIQDTNLTEIQRLATLKDDLEDTRASLFASKKSAEAEQMRAETALEEAQKAREAVQAQIEKELAAEAAEAARIAAEAEAQAAEEARIEQEAAAENTPPTPAAEGYSPAPSNPPAVNQPSQIDWSSDKAAFVDQWAGRIDAYLSGSPMAGQGTTFAAAAWDNGVDPRFSPAISNTESSKGLYCFRPHNAWGWGSSSWGSWEEAINAHVRGLARGYGSTITIEGAKKYCPPNWEHWYNSTLNQMNMI